MNAATIKERLAVIDQKIDENNALIWAANRLGDEPAAKRAKARIAKLVKERTDIQQNELFPA